MCVLSLTLACLFNMNLEYFALAQTCGSAAQEMRMTIFTSSLSNSCQMRLIFQAIQHYLFCLGPNIFSITLRFPNWDPIEVSHLLRLFFAVSINLVEWARKPSYLELSLRISGSFTYSNNAGALKTLLAWDAELKW